MKIYIAEDEPLASAKLKLFLDKLGEGSDTAIFDNGFSVLAAIDKERPDLLFLDIQMPGMTGMEVLQRIQGLPVIITSAYDQYAIESFNLNVTDYLLKPYSLERLKAAIEKGKKALRLLQIEQQEKSQQLIIRVEGTNEVINIAEMLYIEALKDYVKIVLTNNRTRITLGSISGFEGQLSNAKFLRVHRSFLVNTQKIVSQTANSITLTDGQEIPLGRTYKKSNLI